MTRTVHTSYVWFSLFHEERVRRGEANRRPLAVSAPISPECGNGSIPWMVPNQSVVNCYCGNQHCLHPVHSGNT